MSVAYRDRQQSRFDDSKSAASARTNATKVTRYIVKEDDSRSEYRPSRAEPRSSRYEDSRSVIASRFDDTRNNYDDRVEETRTIHVSPPRDYSRAYSTAAPGKYTRETITIRRDEEDKRDEYWQRPSGENVEDRELVIRRDTERDTGRDGRTSVALSRIDDRRDTQVISRIDDRRDTEVVARVDDRRDTRYSDYDMVSPQRRDFDDREISRYIRTSEHYYPQQQNQPQTIIIRQEPIIIRERERERPREEEFQIVKKSDIDDERSITRRSERQEPRDEEYFYEKRVRERIPEEDRRGKLRREVSPGDSISQVGRNRRGRRASESDDSMVYVRKEKITEYGSRDSSEHRNRDLAAGALAGVGAAELFRNHNQKEGKETSTGFSRVAKDAGAGIVGAVAAEGIRRYRSKSRRRSRSRSSSSGRRSHRRRSRSRSRSSSKNRFGNIGGLGLAAAAVAAGALIASRKKKEASPERRSRSRSRRRSSSRGRSVSSSRLSELENDSTADDARNPKHRNTRTAAAGAIGAAAAALLERHRSKSRGRGDSESPDRFKQGIPVVATGLGTAALAHLYEKNKAKREAENIVREEDRRSRSRGARSRSRGRNDSFYQDAPRRASYSDPNLVQYGNEPMYGSNYGAGYYGGARPSEPDYYNNSNRAMVPAPAPPPAVSSFDATSSRNRPRSESRPRSVSSSRSRSRSRGAAAAAAAAGAGIAASAYDQNRKAKKDRRRQSSRGSSRQQTFDSRASVDPYNGRDPYEDANWHATHSASYAQGMNDPYGAQAGFYPPPPGPMPQQAYAPTPQPTYAPTPQPPNAYGPQDFPPPPPHVPQAQQPQFNPYAPGQNPYAPRSRGADDNVSAGHPSSAPTDQHHYTSDGVKLEPIMSPPLIGPDITLQRPSVSTPSISQPRNKFPGSGDNPFTQQSSSRGPITGKVDGINSGEASPGYRGTPRPTQESRPERTLSRAAQTYTPLSQPTPQPAETPKSDQSTPRPDYVPSVSQKHDSQSRSRARSQSRDAAKTVTQPSSSEAMSQAEAEARSRDMQAPTAIPSHVQRPIPKSVPRSQASSELTSISGTDPRASPEPMRIPKSIRHDANTNQKQHSRPEMIERDSKRGFVAPFMPSPDIRPPSDDSLPERQHGQLRGYLAHNGNAPSMPNLIIPSPEHNGSSAKSPDDRPVRQRSPSVGDAANPRARRPSPTPTNSHKRSVSFNPRLDFNEAPKNRHDDASESESGSPETGREKRHDRDRDRDRERDWDPRNHRDKDRRGYEAGDDFSDDTPLEDHRRRSRDNGDKDRERRSSRRERSDTQSLDRDQDRDRKEDRRDKPRRSSTMGGDSHRHHGRDRDGSPGSEGTEDLPERFDDRGRQKPGSYGKKGERTTDQDLLAQSLDQILGGLFGKGKK